MRLQWLQATFRAYFENAKIGNGEGGSRGGEGLSSKNHTGVKLQFPNDLLFLLNNHGEVENDHFGDKSALFLGSFPAI